MNTTITMRTTTTTSTTASTTTTVTTNTITMNNVCIGVTTYITELLYLSLISPIPWTEYSFNYTAPNITSATLHFALRNDPNFWYLDDVSVTNSSGDELLSNGGFEQGTLSGWTYCNPSNASHSGQVSSSMPHTGSYSYADGSVGAYDYLSQTFTVVPNNIYSIQFWLYASSSSATFALITITS